MAGVVSQGGTFTFTVNPGYGSVGGILANFTGLTVDVPEHRVVDMTPIGAHTNTLTLVPVGVGSPGRISVDYYRTGGVTVNGQTADESTLSGKSGTVSFACPGYSVSKKVVLESASVNARVGDLVRGTLKFVITDHTGT